MVNNGLKRKATSEANSGELPESNKRRKFHNHWSLGLLSAMEKPENIVTSDDLVVVIRDKYPKAEFHYLVLPKENISSLKEVTPSHLNLLKHMNEVAQKIVKDYIQHKGKVFKFGYHAAPSMERLHLHVFSDDMNSKFIKTKKHWNSFTSPFLLNSEDVCKSLETNGKIAMPSREEINNWMFMPLKCHKCDFYPKHMPELRQHLLTHLK